MSELHSFSIRDFVPKDRHFVVWFEGVVIPVQIEYESMIGFGIYDRAKPELPVGFDHRNYLGGLCEPSFIDKTPHDEPIYWGVQLLHARHDDPESAKSAILESIRCRPDFEWLRRKLHSCDIVESPHMLILKQRG